MRQRAVFVLVAVLFSLVGKSSFATELSLPAVFSDHAVLQRDKPIHVWGEAGARQRVTVRFHEQTLNSTADENGQWQLWLRPETAGGPYTLEVQAEDVAKTIQRSDILVGDVWIASGQSNMEFPLAGFTSAPLANGEHEIAEANQPKLRLLLQPRRTSAVVLSGSDAQWTLCTPETAKSFSAVAYFFGREISEHEHVPVGLIDATWGGTPADAWMSNDAIAYYNLTSVMRNGARVALDQGRADALRAQYSADDAADKAAGRVVNPHPRIPGDHAGSWAPATLFNAMIAPYTAFTLKGAIWYQGETDANPEGAPNYERVFSALIQDWRRQWAQGSLPFFFVQISSFGHGDPGWGGLRDAQRRVADELKDTGMAVTLDIGLSDNVHPPDKQTVGHRLALLARDVAYGEKVEAHSPSFVEATIEPGAMRVWLAHAKGLASRGLKDGDFEVAGADHKFFPATAQIDGSTVIVRSTEVANPEFVRYDWKGTVDGWLVNDDGLPMGTFTSERE